VRLPELETVLGTIGSTLGSYTYALVAVMAFLETGAFVGLLVPGETVVIVGGVVAGQGHIELLPLLGLTWCCAFAGDFTGYLLGRRLGRRFLLAHGARVGITEARLVRVEEWFARYGLATILIGRFVGLVRPVAPFLAGASRYPAGRFCALAVLGTGLWSAAFLLLGFLCWQSLDQALAIAKRGSLGLAATVALLLGLVVAYRYLRTRPRRAQHSPGRSAGRIQEGQHNRDSDPEHDQGEHRALEGTESTRRAPQRSPADAGPREQSPAAHQPLNRAPTNAESTNASPSARATAPRPVGTASTMRRT
jgi:membrane protein DedA with SNARE-associated domain